MNPICSQGPDYDYPVPLDTADRIAYLRMPRQLTRHDAAKLKRVIDALALDDETFIRWDQHRAARKAAVLVQANLLRLWVSAPHVARLTAGEVP